MESQEIAGTMTLQITEAETARLMITHLLHLLILRITGATALEILLPEGRKGLISLLPSHKGPWLLRHRLGVPKGHISQFHGLITRTGLVIPLKFNLILIAYEVGMKPLHGNASDKLSKNHR